MSNKVLENLDEPDWEGQMAKTELKAVCDKADKLVAMLKDEDQLEAWVQSKISNAKMHIDAVYDYLTYRDKPEMEAKVPNIAAGPGSLTVLGSKSVFEDFKEEKTHIDFFAEAKRGRPRKDGAKFAGEDDTQEADKNIMNQLRKKPEGEHQNLTFNNGEKKKVHVIHATRALSMLQNAKPSDRLDLQNSLAHSHSRFMDTVRSGKAIKDEPRAKVTLAKRVAEEAEQIEEKVSVDKKKFSWGNMLTVHHGASHSYPLHPEHQEKIAKLKDGESVSFTDETKAKVKAHREGDTVHLSHEGSSAKTPVAYSHFSEEYVEEGALDTANATARGAWDSLTIGGGKYLRGAADYAVKKGLHALGKGPDTTLSREIDQEREKDAKAQAEHPTAWDVGSYGATAATMATGVGGALKVGAKFGLKGAAKLGQKMATSPTLNALDRAGMKGLKYGAAGHAGALTYDPDAWKRDMGVNEEAVSEDLTIHASDRRARKAVTYRDANGKIRVKWMSQPKKEIDIGESTDLEEKTVAKPKIKTGEVGFMKGGGPEQHASIAEAFLIDLTEDQIQAITTVYEKLNETNKNAFISSASRSTEGSLAMLEFVLNIE